MFHSIFDELRFLRFFPLVTWGCISPRQILWLCRPIEHQNVHYTWLYKTAKSKTFFLNFLSSSFFFSFVFSIYLHYFLRFFFCIISDVPLLPICISSTSKHMFCCIFLYFTWWAQWLFFLFLIILFQIPHVWPDLDDVLDYISFALFYVFLPLPFIIFNPIKDGHFWGCSRIEGEQKDPPP